MNKTQLKEVIHNIVEQKITSNNTGEKASSYGYIIADKDTKNPRIQLIGYGNMPKNIWKEKIVRDITDLKKLVEDENWQAAAYIVDSKGILHNALNMMKEIFSDSTIKEIESNNTSPNTLAINTYKNKLNKTTNDLRKVDTEASRLQEPVRTKVQRLDRKKADLQKKQSRLIDKLNSLKDKK